MSEERHILALLDEGRGLTCLPRFWGSALKRYVRDISDDTVHDQLRERLDRVSEFLEPLTRESENAPFSEMCHELAEADDAGAIANRLGLRDVDPSEPATWLDQLVPGRTHVTPDQQLYAVTICWLVLPLHHSEPTANVAEFLDFKLPLLLLTALHAMNCHHSIVGLGEAMADLNVDDFRRHETLVKAFHDSPLSRFRDQWSVSQFVYLLATSLQWIPTRGRRHALAFLECWLGLDGSEYDDGELLRHRLAEGPLGQIECAVTQANLIALHANCLAALPDEGSPDKAVSLLEAWLGIETSDYNTEQELVAAIASSPLCRVKYQAIWANVVRILATSLAIVRKRGQRQALRLLEVWLDKWIGVPQQRFVTAEELAAAMYDRLLHAIGDREIVNGIVEILTACWIDLTGHHAKIARQTVALLEASLGLTPEHYESPDSLTAALNKRVFQQFENPEMMLLNLAAALSRVDGRRVHASRVLENWLEVPVTQFASSRRLQRVPATTILRFPQAWLRAVGPHHPLVPDVCEGIVQFVKSTRTDLRTSPHARDDFLHEMTALGREIVSLALDRSRQARRLGQRREADKLELHALAWADEFENRTLVERARLSRHDATQSDRHLEIPSGNWPFRFVDMLDDEQFEDGYSPKRHVGDDQPLHWRADDGHHTRTSVNVSSRVETADDIERGDVNTGISDLHGLLPANVVLIRTLFDRDGSLHWWALQSDSNDVKILARQHSEVRADARLKIASFSFDLAVESIWAAFLLPPGRQLISAQQHDDLLYLAEMSEDQAFAENELSSAAKCERVFKSIDCALTAVRSTHPVFTSLGDNLLAHLFWQPDGRRDDAPPALLQLWRKSAETLRTPWPEAWGTRERDQRRCRELDAATKDFCSAVEREMPLTPLWHQTKDRINWRDIDVVLQLQWALWAAPLAWLDFGGRPLFEQVASTSSAISLTWRHDAEHRAADESSRLPRRVISAHWLDERDWKLPMRGLGMLHGALLRLAARHDWALLGLADEPVASDENLRAVLAGDDGPSSDVVVIGGHGHCAEAGIQLADGIWTGRGADLRQVNLLFLVACAVGRLEQTGFRDVEGMYANLVAQGCVSVIAARWPIADSEAAIFVAEFMNQYMETVEYRDGPPAFARARALNRARQFLLKKHSNSRVTSHLVAAFELYGLG